MTRERLISLDVFRGLTILLMTIVNNPGDWGQCLSSIITRRMARLHPQPI